VSLDRGRESGRRNFAIGTTAIDRENCDPGFRRKLNELEPAMVDSQQRLDFDEYG